MLTRTRMRICALALVLAPSLAAARPITAGVTAGETQAEVNANANPSGTLGLFGRLGLTGRLSAQLELQRIDTSDSNIAIRTGTALAVFDLTGGRLVPTVCAGAGIDIASAMFGETDAHHFEAGLGLEYRASGGLVVGLDARIGTRSIDSDSTTVPIAGRTAPLLPLYQPSYLSGGQYRSVRATIGVHF